MTEKKAISKTRKYVKDKQTNVFISELQSEAFNYSDGDVVENVILNAIQHAKDVSLGSIELSSKINDWPTRYHLSAQRADLLRPLENLFNGDILEIGSGCGAITRYLGECGANLTALEGSYRRAVITAARCRDLTNVHVYSENFDVFETNKKFDVITLIGVFEYFSQFVNEKYPQEAMLNKIKGMLKSDGVLIIAIENQLGLKYLAGAPEDHLNIPYAGIENQYQKKGPMTYGKKRIEKYLNDTDFGRVDFLYPFPDYKFPLTVVSEKGATDKKINLPDILKFKIKYFQGMPYKAAFDENKAFPVLADNKLVEDLSNSFLIIANAGKETKLKANELAYVFSTQRRKSYRKLNKILIKNNEYWVERSRIYHEKVEASTVLTHQLTNEIYLFGELYSNQLLRILERKDWSVEMIVEWSRPWITFLHEAIIRTDNQGIAFLNGKYFDATPFNMIVPAGENDSISSFDLEWEVKKELRIDYIVFRGLYYSFFMLSRIPTVDKIYTQFSDVSLDIVKAIFPAYPVHLESYIEIEKEIINEIVDEPSDKFFTQLIPEPDRPEPTFELFERVTETKVQIFWAIVPRGFSEEASVSKQIVFGNTKSRVLFRIPPQEEKLNFIRFDIGNKPGMLNIHGIDIKNDNNEVLWSWDKYCMESKENILFLENQQEWPNRVIQLASTIDPQFVILTNDQVKEESVNGCMIDIYLSAIDADQLECLNRSANPFIYSNGKTQEEYTDTLELLKEEKKQLTLQLISTSEKNHTLAKEVHLHSINAGKTDEITQQILSEKTNLISDKEILNKDIALKNDLIRELILEKQQYFKESVDLSDMTNKLKSDLIVKESEYADLERKQQQLQNDLTNNVEKSNQLSLQLDYLKKTNESNEQAFKLALDNFKNQFSEFKILTTDELNKKNELITGFSAEHERFHAIIKSISEKLDEEQKINNDLLRDIDKKNNEILVGVEQKTNLQTQLSLLTQELSEYKSKYDNKRITQIIINRYFKRK